MTCPVVIERFWDQVWPKSAETRPVNFRPDCHHASKICQGGPATPTCFPSFETLEFASWTDSSCSTTAPPFRFFPPAAATLAAEAAEVRFVCTAEAAEVRFFRPAEASRTDSSAVFSRSSKASWLLKCESAWRGFSEVISLKNCGYRTVISGKSDGHPQKFHKGAA